MKISVTEGNITNGVPKSCDNCPVARAMRQAGINNPYASGRWLGGTLGKYGVYVHLETSRTVAEFIRRFDGGLEVEPFEFELELT